MYLKKNCTRMRDINYKLHTVNLCIIWQLIHNTIQSVLFWIHFVNRFWEKKKRKIHVRPCLVTFLKWVFTGLYKSWHVLGMFFFFNYYSFSFFSFTFRKHQIFFFCVILFMQKAELQSLQHRGDRWNRVRANDNWSEWNFSVSMGD